MKRIEFNRNVNGGFTLGDWLVADRARTMQLVKDSYSYALTKNPKGKGDAAADALEKIWNECEDYTFPEKLGVTFFYWDWINGRTEL